jgi:serine/threonine-protein kinase
LQESGTRPPTDPIAECPTCGWAHAPADACAGSRRTLALGGTVPQPDAGDRGAAPPREVAPAPGRPEQDDPLVGTRVGSFHLVRLLGRGGMGTVYLAEHPVIGSRVAVKFLHEWLATDPALVARFYDEARAVNLIGHENIVGIYDLSVLPPNRYFFVMELLEGDTLLAHLRAGSVDPAVARDVLLQMCDALQCAHEHGVVHRDLKPENVFLVRRRGKAHFVKLVDFGIAKLRSAGASAPGRTQTGFIVGTPEYMSPEQCEDGAIDARSDVYALGVMAFELFTGRLPFTGKSVTQLLLAQLRDAPPRPSSIAPAAAPFDAAILRALEKDPAARFPDMASFAAALREAQPAAPRAAAIVAPPPGGPEPPAPPPAAPAAHVEVSIAGAPPQRLPLVELTRGGGVFVRKEQELPPLRTRLRLALAHPSLRASLDLEGEVVRHVSPAEAASWNTAPGFAVQLAALAPEARAAIATLADGMRRDTPAAGSPRSAELVDARLAALEARGADTHYAFLALPPDAEFADIRRALRAAREELEAARSRPLSPAHPARATALLARVDAALEALGTPASRLAYDARRGNAGGVARCLAAGVPAPLVAARRRELLSERPDRAAEAQRQLARAEVARKLGNAPAAAQAYEAALAADPLDVAAHEALAALRRGSR